ncbi:g5075 [Coccomyxa viridis]|uniref:G5075 protein n=1 Tax=Coccomyxa viridis TaxID=1274662 RepID=A0ABP1FRX3_9CHLO
MAVAVRALLTASLIMGGQAQSYPGLSWPSVPDGSMNGMNNVISSFLNNTIVDADMNAVAANLAGISYVLHRVPLLGERISASLEDVSDTLRATAQSANSKISRAAEEQLAHQITAADSTLHRADSTLHSTVEDIASELPKNNTVLYISGKPSKADELKLGDKKSGWAGFEIPKIDLGDGVVINPASVDLNTLEQLVDDVESQFCSPTFTNSSGIVGATLTYPTFTLTLATGACALTNDFTPNPDNPYDNWLNTKGFVCKTPELSFKQEPSSYVSEYTAPATLITSSCKIAKNTTDGWTKTLYSAGDPVTYASWEEFMDATANGTATPVFSPSDKKGLMAEIAAELHSHIADIAAAAPPLVIHVKKGKDLLPQKTGRRLKELIQRLT